MARIAIPLNVLTLDQAAEKHNFWRLAHLNANKAHLLIICILFTAIPSIHSIQRVAPYPGRKAMTF